MAQLLAAPSTTTPTTTGACMASACHCECHFDMPSPARSSVASSSARSPWQCSCVSTRPASAGQISDSEQSSETTFVPAASPSLGSPEVTKDTASAAAFPPLNPLRPFQGRTVVFLRTSSTARAPVYEALRQKGLRVVMVNPTINRVGFPDSCIDEWIERDTTDVDALYALLSGPEWAGKFDTVASFDEYGVFPAAQLAMRFGLPPMPMSPDALSTVNIKSRFRHWCLAHNITTPRFAALKSRDTDAVAAAARSGLLYPIVVKPAPGAGSNLVTLVETPEDLPAVVDRLWNAIDAMRPTAMHFEALGESIHVLMEEFVEGPEVDVDAIVEHGRVRFAGVSDNFPTVKPYFSEVGGLAPSALSPPVQNQLVQLLEEFVLAMHDDGERVHGVLHFEAKYDERRGQPVVIEVNCRMGSAETHTMVSTGFGVDLAEAAVRLWLGLSLQAMPAHVTGVAPTGSGVVAASANLYPTEAGSLVEIRAPAPHPYLVRAMPFPMPRGASVRLPPESFGCLLWLVAVGPTAGDAVARMKAMCAESKILVE